MSRPCQHVRHEEARLGCGCARRNGSRTRSSTSPGRSMVDRRRGQQHSPLSSHALANLRKAGGALPVYAQLQPLRRSSSPEIWLRSRRIPCGQESASVWAMDAGGNGRSGSIGSIGSRGSRGSKGIVLLRYQGFWCSQLLPYRHFFLRADIDRRRSLISRVWPEFSESS